ncbi:hypothetical protein BDY19DRAFT_963223 [Irpex rosettiformis]|uniref:Uncharacterized protein n=1 Tax=Irpex rosettiformis TaxID=378272 RepID=A0ACB8TVN2_9APHY|nr:hypothetical protein BDY19DRAFT_963223 [Irpex rosettiformis]
MLLGGWMERRQRRRMSAVIAGQPFVLPSEALVILKPFPFNETNIALMFGLLLPSPVSKV